ncbi:MAG: hypothetical protein KGM24_05385, partial [Elusimicrobia bacterium]|nr:hypothetical protein [Elusimicrobiota bacterium]
MSKRRDDALALAGLALAAACVLAGLGRLPALTSDEAWIGLYALRLRAGGLFTPHEMNTYTGPLFGWCVSRVFAALGPGVRPLRLFGAAANVLAFALTALHLRRRAGSAAAAWWAVLLAGSAYSLLHARLAWDVYALQPLLLALILILLDGPPTFARALGLTAAALAGAQNHFIFLSVPASLVVLYGARAAWLGEEEASGGLRLALSALAAGAVLFLVKPRLSEAAWPSERAWALPLFFALAPLAAAAAAAGP